MEENIKNKGRDFGALHEHQEAVKADISRRIEAGEDRKDVMESYKDFDFSRVKVQKPIDGRRAYIPAENHLSFLYHQKRKVPYIDDQQFEAGNELYRHWKKAGLLSFQSVKLDPEKVNATKGGKKTFEMSESQVHHHKEYWRAIRGLDPELQHIVYQIVCANFSAADVDRQYQIPRGYALRSLRKGLDYVAFRLGIITGGQYDARMELYLRERN